MKAFGYIAAIIGGAVAGATAALLLAPEKGEDTRAKIQDSVKTYRASNGQSKTSVTNIRLILQANKQKN